MGSALCNLCCKIINAYYAYTPKYHVHVVLKSSPTGNLNTVFFLLIYPVVLLCIEKITKYEFILRNVSDHGLYLVGEVRRVSKFQTLHQIVYFFCQGQRTLQYFYFIHTQEFSTVFLEYSHKKMRKTLCLDALYNMYKSHTFCFECMNVDV